MALTDKGEVYAWGTFRDENGVFGFDIDTKIQTTPKITLKLETGSGKFVKIASGGDHAIALTSDGVVYTWGYG